MLLISMFDIWTNHSPNLYWGQLADKINHQYCHIDEMYIMRILNSSSLDHPGPLPPVLSVMARSHSQQEIISHFSLGSVMTSDHCKMCRMMTGYITTASCWQWYGLAEWGNSSSKHTHIHFWTCCQRMAYLIPAVCCGRGESGCLSNSNE